MHYALCTLEEVYLHYELDLSMKSKPQTANALDSLFLKS